MAERSRRRRSPSRPAAADADRPASGAPLARPDGPGARSPRRRPAGRPAKTDRVEPGRRPDPGGATPPRAEAPDALPAQRPSALLRALGTGPRRGLGQHFLTSPGPVRRAIAAAELGPDDVVLEIGPGLGILTQALIASAGRVVAVELDRVLAERLTTWRAQAPHLEVLQADVLQLDLCQHLTPRGYKVVANLPFNVAAPTLRHLLESPCQPSRLVVMLQLEVAERIVAAPGALSVLGLSIQFYAAPRMVAKVPPGAFYPPPRVTSAIIRLDVRDRPALDVPVGPFFTLVRAGFALPRKQIRNSLAAGLARELREIAESLAREPREVAEGLVAAGIDPRRRPETLALAEWGDLFAEAERRGWLGPSDE